MQNSGGLSGRGVGLVDGDQGSVVVPSQDQKPEWLRYRLPAPLAAEANL